MSDKSAVPVEFQEGKYNVVLPCGLEDFREFVSGLLGKPQVIEGRVSGIFDVGVRDIGNVVHLIQQRVQAQNEGTMVHLAITVSYEDGTSVTHNSLNQFETHYPIDSTVPVEVVIGLTYLIKFNGKEAPEKQERVCKLNCVTAF